MPVKRDNPADEIYELGSQIISADPYAGTEELYGMDERELSEREEAAQAYAGENEKHFVDYVMDCVDESIEANKDIRNTWSECWHMYNEWEPDSYKSKEKWQSRIVVPKPFQTVQFGAAAVKKAFSPNYLSVTSETNDLSVQFWQKVLDYQLGSAVAKFVTRFADAVVMAYAVGQSMEFIPLWVPGKGLEFSLVEPWKIHRDPDAMSRQSQSGMYWIHQEWLDFFVIKQGEENGRYFDIDRVKNVTEDTSGRDELLSKDAIAARKRQLFERSSFRKLVLASEFYGTVLDPKGNMLLPSANLTVAGYRCIQKPIAVPYRRLRWPGSSFSALPNLLRFGGRGLLEGVRTIWNAINEIMNLHMDGLKWEIDPPTEYNVEALVDPEDVDDHPGKKYLTRDTVNGQHAVRTVERHGKTNAVLANMQFFDQNFQRGAFVTDAVQGLPGYRKDITFREAAMNLDQAMGVFGLMGEALEEGAIGAIDSAVDVIESNIGYHELEKIFGADSRILKGLEIEPNPESSTGVSNIPPLNGRCHVSGMQALMRDQETLKALKEVVIPLSESPRYAPYIKPYKVIKAFESRVNLTDEAVFADEKEAQIIDMQERLMAIKRSDAAESLARLQEAIGITGLVEKLQKIDSEDIRQSAEEIMLMERMYNGTRSQDRPGKPAADQPPQ